MRFLKNDSSEDKSDDAADSEALRLTHILLFLLASSYSHLPHLLYIFASIISFFEFLMSVPPPALPPPPHYPVGSHNMQDNPQDLLASLALMSMLPSPTLSALFLLKPS